MKCKIPVSSTSGIDERDASRSLGVEVPTLQIAVARPGVRVELTNGRSRLSRVVPTSNKNKNKNKNNFSFFLKRKK